MKLYAYQDHDTSEWTVRCHCGWHQTYGACNYMTYSMVLDMAMAEHYCVIPNKDYDRTMDTRHLVWPEPKSSKKKKEA